MPALAAVAILAACGPQTPSSAPSAARSQAFTPTPDPAELCSGANAVGVGLRGSYFGAAGLQGDAVLTRTDASINFTGLEDLPAGARSVRWNGWVKGPTNGPYRFHVQPAGVRVTVVRTDVKADGADSVPVEMIAGRYYPITVEVDDLSVAKPPIKLEWTVPHGARYVIPRQLLNTPSDQVQVRVEPLKAKGS